MHFYDTHAHLDGPRFAQDLSQVVARAHVAGIDRILTLGTDGPSSERSLRISEQYPGVYAAVGWHPNDLATAPEDVRPCLRPLARHPRVVAIGEIGLDYYHLPRIPGGEKASALRDRDGQSGLADVVQERERLVRRQKEVFRQQLELAVELGLNCVIHQRDALEDTLAVFEPFADRLCAVFHCFAGDPTVLRRIISRGALVSYTGIVTFPNGQTVRETLAETPADRFMFETDCPYMAPVPYRGKRCEPAHIREIAAVAADVRRCSLEELGARTCATADAFFRWA
jgi:TatD DNase family protein